MERKCPKCSEVKIITEFKHDKSKNGGYSYVCRKCDNENRRLRYYKNHDNELVRFRELYKKNKSKWAEKAKKHQLKYPEKEFARRLLRSAVRTGKIDKKPCEVCGKNKNIHGHHEDYYKPLEVVWLCARHHMEKHRHFSHS